MDKQNIVAHTMKMIDSIASLRNYIQENPDLKKEEIIKKFYEIDDNTEQLERGLVQFFEITEEDVDNFEKKSFLQNLEGIKKESGIELKDK
jgi:hypothetical protein